LIFFFQKPQKIIENFQIDNQIKPQVTNETNVRLHKKAPTQIPLSPQNHPASIAAKLPLENDAVILTLLKNYDWLVKTGIRCLSGNFKLTSTKSLNCKS
jgi:hypothetical protein